MTFCFSEGLFCESPSVRSESEFVSHLFDFDDGRFLM